MTKVLSVDWMAYSYIGDSTAPYDYQGRYITGIVQNGTATSVFVRTNARGEGETSPAGMHVNLSLTEQPGQDRWRLRIGETYQNSSKNKFLGSDIMPWFKGSLKYVRVNYFVPGDYDGGASSYRAYDSGGASYGEFFPASLVRSTNGAYLQAPAGCTKIAVCAVYSLASASVVTMVGLWFGAIDLKSMHFAPSATYTDYRGGAGWDFSENGRTEDYTREGVLVPKRRLDALGRDIVYSATQYMFLVSPGVSVTVHAYTVVPDGGAPRRLRNHYVFHGWYRSEAGPDRVVTPPAYIEAYYCSHALCSAKFDSQDKSRNLVYGASGQLLYDHATTT